MKHWTRSCPCGDDARSVRSPRAGGARRSVRAAMRVLAFAAGRPDRVPGQPGASHLHDFFGNTGVNASSTFRPCSPARPPAGPERHGRLLGPAGFVNGVRVKPGVMRIYYLGSATGTLGTIPAGLQMVGGNKEAQSPGENPHVSWSCGQTTSVSTPSMDTPYDCRPWAQYTFVDGIVASIDFPSCWNGTASARRRHVPEEGACPQGFGNVIPKLSERVHYGVMNPLGLDGTLAFQLSSGPPYSMHADFWNTWEQERLDQLVADCLIANAHCGSVDATSTIRWVRQFGTQRYDLANAAAPDGKGGSYTAGFTNFSLDGQRTTTDTTRSSLGTTRTATSCGPGNSGRTGPIRRSRSRSRGPVCTSWVQPTGGSQQARGGPDAFVARFNACGRLMWLKKFGTHRDDESAAVSASGCDPPRRHDARAARSATPRRAVRRIRDAARDQRSPS